MKTCSPLMARCPQVSCSLSLRESRRSNFSGVAWISSYKNTRLCYIPDHVIVRNVGQMLHGDEPADEHDQALRGRITYSLRVLIEYAKALRLVRESGVIDLKAFPYGM